MKFIYHCIKTTLIPKRLLITFRLQVESGKLVLENAEFDLGRELEGLVDMFSVQCINHSVEIILDLSGMNLILVA